MKAFAAIARIGRSGNRREAPREDEPLTQHPLVQSEQPSSSENRSAEADSAERRCDGARGALIEGQDSSRDHVVLSGGSDDEGTDHRLEAQSDDKSMEQHQATRAAELSGEQARAIEDGDVASLEAPPCSRKRCQPTYWITTLQADLFFGALIALNSILIGIEVDVALHNEGDSGWFIWGLQSCFIIAFGIELVLRIYVQRCAFFTASGIFDAIVVVVPMINLWLITPILRSGGASGRSPIQVFAALRILQLIRLARIARLFHMCRELSLLLLGLVVSVRTVFWVFCLLFACMYVGALFCAGTLGHNDRPELRSTFGSVGSSVYSHFKIVTLEAWPDINDWAVQESPLWAFYFLAYIVLTNIALVNLVTGIVVEKVLEKAESDDIDEDEKCREQSVFVEVLRWHFDAVSSDGHLDREGYKRLYADPEFLGLLSIFDVSTNTDRDQFFDLLDFNADGTVDFEEFAGSLSRLRGSRCNQHPMLALCDLHSCNKMLAQEFESVEARACERYCKGVQQFEAQLFPNLEKVQDAAVYAASEAEIELSLTQHPTGAKLSQLLETAHAKMQVADSSLQKVEAALSAALAYEADLAAQLALRQNTCCTQTEPLARTSFSSRLSLDIPVVYGHACTQTTREVCDHSTEMDDSPPLAKLLPLVLDNLSAQGHHEQPPVGSRSTCSDGASRSRSSSTGHSSSASSGLSAVNRPSRSRSSSNASDLREHGGDASYPPPLPESFLSTSLPKPPDRGVHVGDDPQRISQLKRLMPSPRVVDDRMSSRQEDATLHRLKSMAQWPHAAPPPPALPKQYTQM